MKSLFNSQGQHIANVVNGRLYKPTGQNIGVYRDGQRFFVDLKGYYMGEIVRGNRLMHRNHHPQERVCFGSQGLAGSVGNYGNPGNQGSIGSVGGYKDVDSGKLS